jgi:hypothetical protein
VSSWWNLPVAAGAGIPALKALLLLLCISAGFAALRGREALRREELSFTGGEHERLLTIDALQVPVFELIRHFPVSLNSLRV